MKRIFLAHLAMMVVAMLFIVGTANADPILSLSSGGTTVVITDNSALDLNPLAGVVTYSGAVSNWFVNVSTGITEPAQGSLSLPYMHVNSVNMSTGAGAITINFSNNDFTYLGPFELQFGGIAANSGTLIYNLYQNPTNAAYNPVTAPLLGNLVGTVGPLGPGSFSGTIYEPGLTADDPLGYALTQQVIVNHGATGSSSFDAVAQVPEPSALLLIGTGLAGLGVWRMRRKP